MTLPTLACARAVRDGGIDAMAALNGLLPMALAGLSDDDARALKRRVGEVMAEVVEKLINPSVHAFPELDPDVSTSRDVARERAMQRSLKVDEGSREDE